MDLLRFWKKIRETIAEQPLKKKQVLTPEVVQVVHVVAGHQSPSAVGLRATAAELEWSGPRNAPVTE